VLEDHGAFCLGMYSISKASVSCCPWKGSDLAAVYEGLFPDTEERPFLHYFKSMYQAAMEEASRRGDPSACSYLLEQLQTLERAAANKEQERLHQLHLEESRKRAPAVSPSASGKDPDQAQRDYNLLRYGKPFTNDEMLLDLLSQGKISDDDYKKNQGHPGPLYIEEADDGY